MCVKPLKPAILAVGLLVALSGCGPAMYAMNNQQTQRQADPSEGAVQEDASAVELRSIQSRAFDTKDEKKLIRTIAATLQDLGYQGTNVSVEAGTVSAYKMDNCGQVQSLYGSQDIACLENISVTVRKRNPEQLLVRANVTRQRQQVTRPRPYRRFFDALSEAQFLEANRI